MSALALQVPQFGVSIALVQFVVPPRGNVPCAGVVVVHGEADLLELLMHWDRRAASRADCTAGSRREIRTAIMAITTSSSISVKPRRVPLSSMAPLSNLMPARNPVRGRTAPVE